MKKNRGSRILNVSLFIILVKLTECKKLAELLNERLNYRDTRKVLLREIR